MKQTAISAKTGDQGGPALKLKRHITLRALTVAVLLTLATAGGTGPALAITSEEYLERAQEYFDDGELDASIIELKTALQKDRKNAQARLLLGQVYLRTHQHLVCIGE